LWGIISGLSVTAVEQNNNSCEIAATGDKGIPIAILVIVMVIGIKVIPRGCNSFIQSVCPCLLVSLCFLIVGVARSLDWLIEICGIVKAERSSCI
jgi:hypothetical protein